MTKREHEALQEHFNKMSDYMTEADIAFKRCGKEIAVTRQFITDEGFEYKTENADCRFIDKWGYARNFCKACMR